ncbi:MAG: class I SAM-dependent methyltransferase [Oligoflexia bacterium]|nr:class I SAM-dependent methyltransferase [Oligoflexia bacterium]
MLADKFIKPFKKMSVENMNTIEEAFDFASRLERQTKKTASLITKNLYGNNISLDVIKKQEDIIINKIGTLLGITFQLYFKRIFKLTEGMEAKEREDILNSFKKLRPYFFASKLLERAYTIPLGYHGDYHTINMIYSHDAFGATIYEKLVQHGGSSFQACMAVRNRAEYLTNKLRNALTVRDRKKSYKIISIASGPAYEIQKLIDTDTELMENVEISLLDAEIDSLEYAQRKLVEKCIQKSIHLKINYIKMDVLEIIKGKIREQYDFIYTAGLFDYFEDKVARTAGKILYNLLKKEGTLIIGNFSPNNMTKHFMTVISEWNLFYRDREKISQLFGDFSGNFDIEAEPEKINLFACIKREF